MSETRVPLVLGWMIPIILVMVLFVSARFYSKLVVSKTPLGADDYVMAAAAFCGFSNAVIDCISTAWGVGYHPEDVKPDWVFILAKVVVACNILLPLAMSLTKTSLCLTYLRLFPSRLNIIFCWTVISYLICWAIAMILVTFFACYPVKSLWDPTVVPIHCVNWPHALLAFASLNTVSDMFVFLWPAPQLWNIHLPRKERIGLISVFAIGCIVCVVGIIRIWYLHIYFYYAFTEYDPYWPAAILNSVTDTEICLGLICGCIPSLRPLLARLFPRLFVSTKDSSLRTPRFFSGSHSRSFPFQMLSGRGESRSHMEEGEGDEREVGGDMVKGFPLGVIRVDEEVRVEEAVGCGDRGSQEWIVGGAHRGMGRMA